MRITIRPFAAHDEHALIHTINSVCGEGRWMSSLSYEPTIAWDHALDEPGCPCHCLLVVEDDKDLVGWCRIFREPPESSRAPDAGCVASKGRLGVGLRAGYRDRGIGSRVVRAALAWASWASIEHVSLVTRSDNLRAIRVFKCAGFHLASSDDTHIQMTYSPLPLAARQIESTPLPLRFNSQPTLENFHD